MARILTLSMPDHKNIIWIITIFLFVCPAFVGQVQANNSYFKMTETHSSNLLSFPKWISVLSRFSQQQLVSDNECGVALYHPCSIKGWKKLVANLRDKSFDEQINGINNWINSHPYIQDQVNWRISDYWETPYEFMEMSGDCEDYAISKYYSLRALGIPMERLRIMIVQDLNLGGIIHAILGVYNDDGEILILDNQSSVVTPALNIYHYRPVYGVNEKNWWAYYPLN